MPNDNMDVFVKITKQDSHYIAHIIGRHKTDKQQQSELMTTSEPLDQNAVGTITRVIWLSSKRCI